MTHSGKRKNGSAARTAAAVIIIVLSGILLLLSALLLIDARHVRFYLNGGEELRVDCGPPFSAPGVRAVAVGRLTGEIENDLPVRVTGAVDSFHLGDYVLEYAASTMFRTFSTQRVVHVVDETPPVILLASDPAYMPSWLDGYAEEGWSAYDDVDGDVSALVRVENLGDTRLYTVSDSSGNVGFAVRRIPYSIGMPRLSLTGGEELTVDAGFRFDDPGFSATDERGNDLSALVRCEGEVIPYTAGEYTLRYSIENAAGETVEAVRRVTVVPLRNPDTVDPGSKVIYLSFDDGPGPYTDRLLDVLARYNVRASFFVTCRYPDYFDCIGRAFREGHSIGVHTASHDYYTVYSGEEAFFADFEEVEELIAAQTGSRTTLFRFPGGSSNTVSRFNRGIMTRLASLMEGMGYQYFDWNVDSDDAGKTLTTAGVVRNITEGCREEEVSLVLQHDIKPYSVDAVEQVIIWGLRNGYVFAPLDATSPTAHHPIAN